MAVKHPSLTTPPAGGWQPRAGEAGIRVRMYRVGFGDFFLVTFLASSGEPAHVVIDCGVFKGTSQGGDIGSIEAAVEDMARVTGGQLALVVMTHRHADHIAGFARCADQFRGMKVQAVWMPIWESEYDGQAVRFQAELVRTATGLRQHLAALGKPSDAELTARKFMENATGEFDTAFAATGSNDRALTLLKKELDGAAVHYYKAGDAAVLPDGLRGADVSCKVLGPPPVTDLDLMKLMDLQKGVGQYFTGAAAAGAGAVQPFAPAWSAPAGAASRYPDEAFREWLPREVEQPTPAQAAQARRSMEQSLRGLQPLAAVTAAKQLNAFLNNQSLVLIFECRGKQLLFVGDAQAGNWEHWLYATDAPEKAASGAIVPAAGRVLTSLDFYKVGHHGSGNATPRAAAESMCSGTHHFVAMCSTEDGVYGSENPDDPAKGTEVPRVPLLAALATHAALVRSDQLAIKVNGKRIAPQVKAALPADQPGRRFEQNDLSVDCYL
jgi:hypothetical protein